jgi:CRP/FNR family cyclic AMP-dependent transcriptional regulator
MTAMFETLAELQVFSQLEVEALQAIAAYIQQRSCSPSQVILWEGEPCQMVWFVAEGLARASRLSLDGREQVLAYLGPGESLNLVPVLDGGPNLATVVAVTDTTLYAIPCEHFWRIAYRHPEVAQTALKCLATEVRRLSDTVEDLALPTARARLARFLLAQAEAGPTSQRWTRGEIASHIGTGREMVGRTLWALASDGLIRRERGRIVVVDREGLQREAGRLPIDCSPHAPAGVDGIQPIVGETLPAAECLAPAVS